MKSIGITGTQKGLTPRQEATAKDWLARQGPSAVHHGDCIGADEAVHYIAASLGLSITVHPPINPDKRAFCRIGKTTVRDPKDYISRNHDIVDETDEMLVLPEGPEKTRSGTWATKRYAEKKGKKVTIIWPAGRIQES